MPTTRLPDGLLREDQTFAGAVPLFVREAVRLCALPAQEAANDARALLDRMDQIYADDVLLRSYNGYVTFEAVGDYRAFLEATQAACQGYERLADGGVEPLRCRKQAVYLRVMGMEAATRDFRYSMRPEDKRAWDDEIFALEAVITAEEPGYTVPSSELPQNQRELITDYWRRRADEYWRRHAELDRARKWEDRFRRTVNALGIAMLAVPLVFLIISLFTGGVQVEIALMVVLAFVVIGVGVYLFGFLRGRFRRKIQRFEWQGVGQIDRVMLPLAEEEP